MNEIKTILTEEALDFKQIVEHSLHSMFIIDERKVVYANKAALEMLQLEKEEILQTSFHTFLHEEYHEIYQQRLQSVLKHGEIAELMEQKMIRSNGEVFDVEVMASPFYVNNRTFALINIHDIKERKEAERLLIQSEKLSMIGEISAGIVHEIRNPLTALKGFIQLMKTDPNSNQKYLQIMQSELEHIQTIANNLLKYSRPQYDTYTKVNVVSVIKDVLFLLETEAFKNHLTIHFDAKQDFYFVIGDKPQLKQVLLNLVKNALDATPAGKEIFIRIVKGTKQVQIQIEDQGCGIPEEQMNKLGTSFYTTKEKGTGLGLMVSFNIIKNHKGQIFLKSKEGEGSTFTIALPIAVEK